MANHPSLPPPILVLALNPFSPGQTVLIGHQKTMILNWGGRGLPTSEATRQCLGLCFIVITRKGCYWYLVGRGQQYYKTLYNAQDSPSNKQLSGPYMSIEIEKPCPKKQKKEGGLSLGWCLVLGDFSLTFHLCDGEVFPLFTDPPSPLLPSQSQAKVPRNSQGKEGRLRQDLRFDESRRAWILAPPFLCDLWQKSLSWPQ